MDYLPYSSMLVAGAFAFVTLGFAHFASQAWFAEDLPKVVCYVVGLLLIGAVFSAWCLVNQNSPALLAFAAFCAIVVGAGIGTMAGHYLDSRRSAKNQIAVLENELQHQRARVAALERQIESEKEAKRLGHGS